MGTAMRMAKELPPAILLLLSCLSILAHASDPGDVAEPSIKGPNMDMPTPLTPRPNMDMPEPNPQPLVKPSESPGRALNQTGNVTSNQTQEVKQMDLNGKWSMKFNNGTDISLDLILLSSGGTKVMGFGDLMEQSTKNPVTASGSLAAKELSLTIKSATSKYINEKYDECDLDLLIINDTLSGTYALKSGGQSLSQGEVRGAKQ
jgi:hypothetical protein